MKMKITVSGFFSLCTVLFLGAFLSCSKSDKPAPAPAPVAEFEVPAEIKAGVEVVFVNKSTNANTFTWQVNGTNADPAKVTAEGNLKISFPLSGSYNVTLTAAMSEVKNVKTRAVTVGVPSMPVAGFKFERVNPNFILPQYKFTDTSKNATEWGWDFIGSATPTTAQSPLVTFYRINKVLFANQTVKNEAGQSTASASFNPGAHGSHIASYTFPPANIHEDFSRNNKEWSSSSRPTSDVGVNGKGSSGKFTVADTTYAKPPENLLNTAFDVSKQISVSMWVKVSDLGDPKGILFLANEGYINRTPALYYADNKLRGIWGGSQTGGHIASPAITANTWYHIVLNGDGNANKHEMFVNGVSVGTVNDVVSFGSGNNTMFKAYLGWAIIQGYERYLQGNISAVRFFNRVITQEEVNALYHEFD